jgi:hypothetical protein
MPLCLLIAPPHSRLVRLGSSLELFLEMAPSLIATQCLAHHRCHRGSGSLSLLATLLVVRGDGITLFREASHQLQLLLVASLQHFHLLFEESHIVGVRLHESGELVLQLPVDCLYACMLVLELADVLQTGVQVRCRNHLAY